MFKRIAVVCIFGICAFAQQLDSNSITVTASRNATLPPDQAIFSIGVTSGLNTGLADVLAVLQPLGITVTNFTGINGSVPVLFPASPNVIPPTFIAPPLQWSFSLPVPLTKMKDTISTLTSLQQSIGKNNSGLILNFSVQGTQSSQSPTCSISDLMTDARTQAQNLAAASGLTLGNILALSGSTSPVPVCAISVKFAVTRFQ